MDLSHTRAENLLDRAWSSEPDVYLLALLSALAVRPETALLRGLRRRLGPALRTWSNPFAKSSGTPLNLTAATEGRLWHSRLTAASGPSGFSLHSAVAIELRKRLRNDRTLCRRGLSGAFEFAEPGMDKAIRLIEAVREITHERHRSLSPEMRWEEELVWRLSSDKFDQLEDLLAQPLAVLLDEENRSKESRHATAGWLHGALRRQDSVVWNSPMAWALGLNVVNQATPAGARAYRLPIPELPLGSLPSLRRWPPQTLNGKGRTFEQLASRATKQLGVRRSGGKLILSPRISEGDVSFDVPDTRPLIVEIAFHPDNTESQVVLIDPDGNAVERYVASGELELWALNGKTQIISAEPVVATRMERRSATLPDIKLIGRDADLAWLRDWHAGRDRIGVLEGASGSGRSAVLGRLEPEIEGKRFVWRYDQYGDVIPGLAALAEFLDRPGYWVLAEAIKELDQPTTIVLDGLTAAQIQHAEMRKLFDAVRNSSAARLLVSRDLPGNVEDSLAGEPTRRLEPLSLSDTVSLLAAVGRQLPGEELEELARLTSGHPLTAALAAAWISALPIHLAGLKDALRQRSTEARIRAIVKGLMDTSQGVDVLAALGSNADHPLVLGALQLSYEDVLEPPKGHVLEPLARLADDEKDHDLRAKILRHTGHPQTQKEVSPQALMNLLKALEIWEPKSAEKRSWPFWRSVANVIGRVLAQPHLTDEQRHPLWNVLAERGVAGRWRQQQVVSIALEKSGLLARQDPDAVRVFEALWARALPADAAEPNTTEGIHPQLPWTTAKGLDSGWQAQLLIEDFPRLDEWARKRLVLSLVQLPPVEKAVLGRVDRAHPLVRWLGGSARHFLGLLYMWAEHHDPALRPDTIFDLPADIGQDPWSELLGLPGDSVLLGRPEFRLPPMADEVLRENTVRELVKLFLAGQLKQAELQYWFDLASLEIEVAGTSGYSGGRYNLFEHITGVALDAAGSSAHRVIAALAPCSDEGIAWGLAQRLGTSYGPNTTGRDIRNLRELVSATDYWTGDRALILTRDTHEWTVRDTLNGVYEIWLASEAPGGQWNETDDAGARALAEAAARWKQDWQHYSHDLFTDVDAGIERLRQRCPSFAQRWWELLPSSGR